MDKQRFVFLYNTGGVTKAVIVAADTEDAATDVAGPVIRESLSSAAQEELEAGNAVGLAAYGSVLKDELPVPSEYEGRALDADDLAFLAGLWDRHMSGAVPS